MQRSGNAHLHVAREQPCASPPGWIRAAAAERKNALTKGSEKGVEQGLGKRKEKAEIFCCLYLAGPPVFTLRGPDLAAKPSDLLVIVFLRRNKLGMRTYSNLQFGVKALTA